MLTSQNNNISAFRIVLAAAKMQSICGLSKAGSALLATAVNAVVN